MVKYTNLDLDQINNLIEETEKLRISTRDNGKLSSLLSMSLINLGTAKSLILENQDLSPEGLIQNRINNLAKQEGLERTSEPFNLILPSYSKKGPWYLTGGARNGKIFDEPLCYTYYCDTLLDALEAEEKKMIEQVGTEEDIYKSS